MRNHEQRIIVERTAARAFPGEVAFSSTHWSDQDERLWSVTVGPNAFEGWHTVWVILRPDGTATVAPTCFEPNFI